MITLWDELRTGTSRVGEGESASDADSAAYREGYRDAKAELKRKLREVALASGGTYHQAGEYLRIVKEFVA